MIPEEEGRRAFMEKLPKDVCPYDEGKEKIQWKLGYTKQEYDELKEEQAKLLESMGWYSSPYTGLEDIIHNLQSSISQYQNALS